jgi:hypothetical protein
MRRVSFILVPLLALAPASASGRSPEVDKMNYSLTEAEKIPAGRFEWEPEKAIEGSLAILVSLPRQMLYVYRGNVLIARSSISSGRPGRSTPSGSYWIMGKEEMHHSNLYDNAPMPFMQRLTNDGVALHAGYVANYPASHGCIRLPREFAKRLYGITTYGDPVMVTDSEQTAPKGNGSLKPDFIPETSHQPDDLSGAAGACLDKKLPTNPQGANLTHDTRTKTVFPASAAHSGKTMCQLEQEELAIRNNPDFSKEERMRELLRIWSEQRALSTEFRSKGETPLK